MRLGHLASIRRSAYTPVLQGSVHDEEPCVERLNQRTLLSLLESLLGLYAIQNLDAFAANILAELPKFVPSDVTVYSQVNPPQINLIEQPVATDRFPGITERDRLCLNVLRPHLIQADRNAEM